MRAGNQILREMIDAIRTETFTVCVLAGVLVAALFAYAFGADADLITIIVLLGIFTAFAETILHRRNGGNGS